MKYRPEIDGLRTLAILPVIFFHADFNWMPGGFLGVDIFFVISGYLITSILINEQRQQRFSLWFFYERRARRILPALFFVLLSSLIAAWFLLGPQALVHFAQSLIATNLFAANIYFWQHIDYFTGNTYFLPLLHLWSLGIEEQFYVFLPLLFMALWRLSVRALWVILVLIACASLISLPLLPTSASSAAFYLLPTRAWELVAGSLCAFVLSYRSQPPKAVQNQLGSALGLLLILVSIIWLDARMSHPGLWTLAPVVGTALIILYAAPRTYTARFLSLKPIVVVGLLSYSAYLWHQPLFAYTRIYRGMEQLGLKTTLALIVLTFVLAAVSWRWVEQPFRNRSFLRQRTILLSSVGGMALLILIGAVIIQHHGIPSRFNAVQQVLYQYQSRALQQHAERDPCFLDEQTPASELGAECKISPQSDLVMVGDSHAQHLAAGLMTAGQRLPLYSASGCPPLLGIELTTFRPYCKGLVEAAFADIEAQQPPLILLHANWLLSQEIIDLHASDHRPLSAQLRRTTDYLQRIAPTSQIVVIGDVPQWQPSLIDLLTQQAAQAPLESDFLPNASLKQLYALENQIKNALDPQVWFISLADYLCNSDGQCLALLGSTQTPAPMAWDYGHLTTEGAAYLGAYLSKWLPAPSPQRH